MHQKKPIHIEYEIDDKYNPHVDIDADLPTLHEAFQFLMKVRLILITLLISLITY